MSDAVDYITIRIEQQKRMIADYQARHWSTASLNMELAELEEKLEAAKAAVKREARHEMP
jgi:ubiquinone biosynthesis protein UbiJ